MANANYEGRHYVCKRTQQYARHAVPAIGIFYSCGIIASPWIIETNFRRPDQIPAAIIVFGLVLLIAVLFLSSAICMHRRKPIGRTLALLAGPITLFAFWPVAIYSWWFLHTVAGKALYGIQDDASISENYSS